MTDLAEACRNSGLDSRQLRPVAHATPQGRVAVYIGGAWQDLTLGKAMNLRDQLARAIEAAWAIGANGRAGLPTDLGRTDR